MFEVMDHNRIEGAFEVRGHGDRTGEVAIFLGPRARERAAAYAQRENAEASTSGAGPIRASPPRPAPNAVVMHARLNRPF
jgi:hypothetical protein